ncbi:MULTISPECIES: DNA adenine methylase [Gordonibacter]|uniref:site-specific DNA-methyltransferase (adenine-specific) n=1 Tax=Gordonibacter faecis TaxID=3047475 RepID=A0ABT7DQ40_9ACTN|nr:MULTISPECIES: Dam family site-specific DNA-(adenine-N6)-methyltransferase [unclassified Gordonibacter]MDJ1651674.1 Dam family site-specific DNA-(adenine-N6)-methyltransferase [Gordonibacter sp. KGMB12511]HIW77097.1 Dam family site-specific DNA-(adenine-N6)-methyltransferase [Candidatus Gordonibacter avicola]
MENKIKPILKYRGGKSKEIGFIEPYLPSEFNRYIEPFFGGGALFFHLAPRNAIVNDLNERLMGFYVGLRDDYPRVRSELSHLQEIYESNRAVYDAEKRKNPSSRVLDPNEELYYTMRRMFNGLEQPTYTSATLYYFINKTAYSGMIRYNKNGEYNVPYGRYKHFNTHLITPDHIELLSRTKMMCGDYQNVFQMCDRNDFVFLDPPYDCVFSDYGNKETLDGFTEREHKRLAEAFESLQCNALMVIGKTDLTVSLYSKYIIDEYDKTYSVNIRNRFKSESKHIIISNYWKS